MVPYGKVYIYSNLYNSVNAFGEKPYTFNPLIFDVENELLHSNKSFKNIDILRALYLKNFVKNKCDLIYEYINNIEINKKIYKYDNQNLPILKKNYLKQNFYKPFLNFNNKIIK